MQVIVSVLVSMLMVLSWVFIMFKQINRSEMSKEGFAWANNKNMTWITNCIESTFGLLKTKENQASGRMWDKHASG